MVLGPVKSILSRLTRLRLEVETPSQPLHSALGVYDALLAREERVALRADLNFDLRFGRTSRPRISTGTVDRRVLEILWVNLSFHNRVSLG
jgi:hypothetical protein